jgi:hypothetical protein
VSLKSSEPIPLGDHSGSQSIFARGIRARAGRGRGGPLRRRVNTIECILCQKSLLVRGPLLQEPGRGWVYPPGPRLTNHGPASSLGRPATVRRSIAGSRGLGAGGSLRAFVPRSRRIDAFASLRRTTGAFGAETGTTYPLWTTALLAPLSERGRLGPWGRHRCRSMPLLAALAVHHV